MFIQDKTFVRIDDKHSLTQALGLMRRINRLNIYILNRRTRRQLKIKSHRKKRRINL